MDIWGRNRVHVAIMPYVLQSTSASQQSSLGAGINSKINLRNALDTDTNVISQDGARDSLQSPAGQILSCEPWHGEVLLFGHFQVHISLSTCEQNISEMLHKNKMIPLERFQKHCSLSTGGSEKKRSVSSRSLVSS